MASDAGRWNSLLWESRSLDHSGCGVNRPGNLGDSSVRSQEVTLAVIGRSLLVNFNTA